MVSLPIGWKFEFIGDEHTVFFAPNKEGMVTVDYHRRGYRSGINTSGPILNVTSFTGRGWKDNLETDAVTWLQSVLRS
jgi:hypothetical protein